MSDLAIRVTGIGKQYRIGTGPYTTLRERLSSMVGAPLRALRREKAATDKGRFWALKDISFDVRAGEAVGIIGRNGAGKSTLLKVLARVTEPSVGRGEIHGRMSSLLEVGTGFHPELTGRENVYLNGAILGMKKREVERRFDAIVAFAEVERFIDTAVKHYSSGMYLRLAFAVAAHLEPEILVVDEVLAVGDASFQRKCLTKMEDVGQGGRTVLFVSHNMPAVTRLCSRAILLEGGCVVEDGPAGAVAGTYLRAGTGTTAARQWTDRSQAPGNGTARLLSVRVVDETMTTHEVLSLGRKIGLEMVYEVLVPGTVLVPNFHVYNGEGTCIFAAADTDEDRRSRPRPVGVFATTAWIPPNLMNEGPVFVGAALSTMDPVIVHFWEKDAIAFQVVEANEAERSARGNYAGEFPGAVRPLLAWETRDVANPSDRAVDGRAAQ